MFKASTFSLLVKNGYSVAVCAGGTATRMLSTSSLIPKEAHSIDLEPQTGYKSYDDIPKTKTTLGLNVDLLKQPSQLADYMEKSARKLGPIFKLSGMPGLPEMLCVVDPKDVETVYRVGDKDYPKRMEFPDIKRAFEELDQPIGLFFQNGEEWHRHRMPVSKFIMMPRKMAEYHEPFNNVALDYVGLVRRQRSQDNLIMDVTSSLRKWSLESVAFFLLGKRLDCLGKEMPPDCRQFVDDFHKFTTVSEKILFGIPFHRIWRNKTWRDFIEGLGGFMSYAMLQVKQTMKEIEQQSGTGAKQPELGMNFLTYMICSGKMTEQELAVHAIDLLTAGVDSTSLTMASCVNSLATNPEVQEKLRKEVLSVTGQEKLVAPHHIQEMPYLRDTIKETTRLYPVAPNNTRVLKEEVVLSGYKVPAGVAIVMPTIAPGRLPELFPEPDKFKPERWSRSNAELPNSFASLPFGFGRRSCIGRRVAELEMHILLAQLMKNFRIESRDDKPMEYVTKLFYGPAKELNLAFIDI